MVINILISALILSSLSCTSKKSETGESLTSHLSNDTLLHYVAEWKKDSLGCLKLRSKEKAEVIISLLKNDSNDSVITQKNLYQNFGKPNEVQQNNGSFILIYYFDCLCNNGSLVKGSDKCYAKFYIQYDLLKETDFVCE